MLANDLMIDAFNRIKHAVHTTVEDLSEDELISRPDSEANTIAWLIWHLSRVQDNHMAGMAGTEQIWDQGWREKFGLPFDKSATGYGQSSEEVGQVKASAKLLVEYFDTVHDLSINWIQHLKEEDYSKIVDREWDPPVTLGVRLVSVIADSLQHAGQAAYVYGLVKRGKKND